MLRGSYPAKIDDKGRLKIPNAFRALVEDQHGATSLFVTSVDGQSVRIYPMAIWMGVEQKLARMPSALPARAKFLDWVNYYGQLTEFDVQGRVLLSPRLREDAAMNGEVDVLGQVDYLEVWNHERLKERLKKSPLTDDEWQSLAEHGI